MSRHTPGPWRVGGHDERYRFYVDAPNGVWLALVKREPNARLIAQAPLMAQALADFIQHEGECMGDPEDGPGCGYNAWDPEYRCPWCRGMEALDKAGLLNKETGEPI